MKFILLLTLLTAITGATQAQDQVDPALARMRDALRKLTQRVTEAEAAAATAQAAQIAAETTSKDLETKLAAAGKTIKELGDKQTETVAKTDKAIKELEAKLTASTAEITRLNEVLGKWKAGYEKAVTVVKDTDSKRARFEAQAIAAQRKVEDRERKNRELFKLGNEILDRYKKFSLGAAIGAREPFTGLARAKLQTLVQDYADKLEDQTLKPNASPSPAPQTPATNAKPPKS